MNANAFFLAEDFDFFAALVRPVATEILFFLFTIFATLVSYMKSLRF